MNIRADRAPIWQEVIFCVSCVVIVFFVSCVYLGGWGWLNGIPVQFTGDASFSYAYAKIVLQSGWNWHSAFLGAPFGFPVIAFPSTLTFETVIMSALRWITSDPVALLNRTWATCVCIAGLSAYLSMRILGLGRALSICLGVLFATIPYAFYRNVSHFSLEFSLIAIPVTVVMLGMSGELGYMATRRYGWLVAATVLLGLGYIYYTFFICFLLVVALGLAIVKNRDRGSARRLGLCLGLLLSVSMVNLLPSLYWWASHGKPPDMDYKNIAESEVYALKIRDLILPDEHSPLPPLAAAGRRSALVPWPSSNENTTAKIGTIGAVGFLLALLVLVGVDPMPDGEGFRRRRSASIIVLLLLLLSLPGAFGSLFNLFVAADIRAYNRVAPLIGFVSLFMFGSWTEALSERFHVKRGVVTVLAGGCLVFGAFDQNVSEPLRQTTRANSAEADQLRGFVGELESQLPENSMLLMLPLTGFPPDGVHGSMQPYDHAKPTLFSHSLRWSWPQFSLRHQAWLEAMGSPTKSAFFDRAVVSGFTHVWIDHYGMQKREKAVIAALQSSGARILTSDPSGRYSVYELAGKPHSTTHPSILEPITIDYHSGFYARETTASRQPYHWARSEAVMILRNTSMARRDVEIDFILQSFWSESSTMSVTIRGETHRYSFSTVGAPVSIPVHLEGAETVRVHFSTAAKPAQARDPRDLRFGLIDLKVKEATAPSQIAN